MRQPERDPFASGVAVGCAIGFAVAAGLGSTPEELVDILEAIDQTRGLCCEPVPALELARATVVDRLMEASQGVGEA